MKERQKDGEKLGADTDEDQRHSPSAAWSKGYFKNNSDLFPSLA